MDEDLPGTRPASACEQQMPGQVRWDFDPGFDPHVFLFDWEAPAPEPPPPPMPPPLFD